MVPQKWLKWQKSDKNQKGSTPEGVTKKTDLFQYLLLIVKEI